MIYASVERRWFWSLLQGVFGLDFLGLKERQDCSVFGTHFRSGKKQNKTKNCVFETKHTDTQCIDVYNSGKDLVAT